ncbi:MAG: phosphate/phosphite/phosphonate ABC transporter substrate-binding protein [Coriobacteriales bacterium]|nr:phosphate/phosphite/phosphonate ABC transporter substrate-binding protein [Coriobacteriales bacterium]
MERSTRQSTTSSHATNPATTPNPTATNPTANPASLELPDTHASNASARTDNSTHSGAIGRRQFLAGSAGLAIAGFVGLAGLGGLLAACSDTGGSANADPGADDGAAPAATDTAAADTSPITFVFLPDASSADMSASREAVSEGIKAASGRDAEIMTTTDYNVAIEALASGSAGMALLGAEGYVQANRKNPSVQACFTNSDENGTLDEACYYSRICVRTEDAEAYKQGSSYTLTPLEGKSFSFVSATSTSGFKVPSAKIVAEFGLESNELLLENGSFFSSVLLGGSHQGSVVNLLNGDADAAAFDDIDVDMYLTLISGEKNMPGAVYAVRDDADEPFTDVHGKQFTIIASTPVLNAPFCFNEDVVDQASRDAIVAYFCSEAIAGDERIFSDPSDESAHALFVRDTPETCLLPVDDAWYEPIRKMG